jgi:hypothetical protein
MSIPSRVLPLSQVKAAAFRLAATLDENDELHLESFVYTMTYKEAVECQNRLNFRVH